MNSKEFRESCPELTQRRVEYLTANTIKIETQFLIPVRLWTDDALPFLHSVKFILYKKYEISCTAITLLPLDPCDPLYEKWELKDEHYIANVTFKGNGLKR